MYPNPANDIVNFSTTIKKITILNVLGQVVLHANNVSSISAELLHAGLYIVHAEDRMYKLIITH
jgi:hypothetical protein